MKKALILILGVTILTVLLVVQLTKTKHHPTKIFIGDGLTLRPFLISEASRRIDSTTFDLELSNPIFGSPIGPQNFSPSDVISADELIKFFRSNEDGINYLKSFQPKNQIWNEIENYLTITGERKKKETLPGLLDSLLAFFDSVVYRSEFLDVQKLKSDKSTRSFGSKYYRDLYNPLNPPKFEINASFIHRYNRLLIEEYLDKYLFKSQSIALLFDRDFKHSNQKGYDILAKLFQLKNGFQFYQARPGDIIEFTLTDHFNTFNKDYERSANLLNTAKLSVPIRYTSTQSLQSNEQLFLSYLSSPHLLIDFDTTLYNNINSFMSYADWRLWNNMISPLSGMLNLKIPITFETDDYREKQIQLSARVFESFLNTPIEGSNYSNRIQLDLGSLKKEAGKFQSFLMAELNGGAFRNFFSYNESNSNVFPPGGSSMWYTSSNEEGVLNYDLKIDIHKNSIRWQNEGINWNLLEWESSGLFGKYSPKIERVELSQLDILHYNKLAKELGIEELKKNVAEFDVAYGNDLATVRIDWDQDGTLKLTPIFSNKDRASISYTDLIKILSPTNIVKRKPIISKFKWSARNAWIRIEEPGSDKTNLEVNWDDHKGLNFDERSSRFLKRGRTARVNFEKSALQYFLSIYGWEIYKIPSPETQSSIEKIQTDWYDEICITDKAEAANFKIEMNASTGKLYLVSGKYIDVKNCVYRFEQGYVAQKQKPTIHRSDLRFLRREHVNSVFDLLDTPLNNN